MSAERCLCGREAAVEGTLTDESGGSLVALCGRCLTRLDTPRCGICGERKTGRHKAERLSVFEDGEYVLDVPVCDDCRRRAVFGDGREVAP